MASTSETGHAKNVANLGVLNSKIFSFGTSYNPPKQAIKLAALQALETSAANSISQTNTTLAALKNASAAREVAFDPLSALTTRVLNFLKSSDTSEQVDENAKSIVRKIQGARASKKTTTATQDAAQATEAKETRTNSSSQMSYDSRLDNFDKLIKLVASIPQYAPNEADLKVATLTGVYNDLKAKNTAVVSANAVWSNARISRDGVLYKENTGLCDVAMDAKNYIKSVFGSSSSQYKEVSKIKFTNRKK